MDSKYIFTSMDKEGSVKETARSKDLSTRERANFVISSDIMRTLRAKSSREQIPMSRMIDTALKNYLTGSEKAVRYTSLETGITMSHLFELLLFISYQSDLTERILKLVDIYFKNYTYTRCAFKKESQQSVIMGTKFLAFIKDEDNEKFSEFLFEVGKLSKEENAGNVQLLLDGNQLSF